MLKNRQDLIALREGCMAAAQLQKRRILVCAGTPFETLANPNSPKVVVSHNHRALYFSRSVIPFLRGIEQEQWAANHVFYKHIGLYAYTAEALKRITQMPVSSLEQAESLEQLRWLQAGLDIRVGYTHAETIGIDTPEDLARAEEWLKNHTEK